MNKSLKKFIYKSRANSGKTWSVSMMNTDNKYVDQLKKFKWIGQDIDDIKRYLNTDSGDNHVWMQISFIAVIITYGRLFTDSKVRKYSMNKSEIEKYLRSEELEAHDYLMTLRHQYIAHASTDEHEELELNLLFKEGRFGFESWKISNFNFEEGKKEIISKLLDAHTAYIEKRITKFQDLFINNLTEAEVFDFVAKSKEYKETPDLLFSSNYVPKKK
jgi:hypothetical protein